jgi:hypothetical protein
MKLRRNSLWYALNLTLLATHQVDAAFQHEWEMFHVPGGIQFFLFFNVAALFPLLMGFEQVAVMGRFARPAVYAVSCVGLFTFLIHALFIAMGRPEFTEGHSLLILFSILFVSGMQLSTLRKA